MGYDENSEIFSDPLSDKLYKLMKENAKKNTECYREIFKVYPDDTYKRFIDIQKNFNSILKWY